MSPIRIGISPCPNDIFAFYAIMNELIDLEGLKFEIELLDIEQLNQRLFEGSFDAGKASFHAALHLADRYTILQSGAALGSGVGPLLLAREAGDTPDAESSILCPGKYTTAALLFQMFYPESKAIEHTVFSEIMPALQRGSTRFGVVIHEGRFTFEQYGLHLVCDLGQRWEADSGEMIPLGGILARRELSADQTTRINRVIQRSIEHALNNRSEALPYMRRYAQELSDNALWKHVELYVNEFTVALGLKGERALSQFFERAIASDALPLNSPEPEICGGSIV